MNKHLKALTKTINNNNRLRVWSVIMTFFGDAIVPRGGAVSVKTVQELMSRLGIEDGAVRTAFSRLTQDGWVTREKQGRNSFYCLSDRGYMPFEEATRQIYAPPKKASAENSQWLIAINKTPALQPLLIENPTQDNIRELTNEDFLLVSGELANTPDWIKAVYAPQDAADGYRQLITEFANIAEWNLSPIDAMAARCLLIHEWRKLLLRYKRVPPQLRPKDWPEDVCLELIANRYHLLLPDSETWLDEHATGPKGPLPTADLSVLRRFA